VSTRTVHGITAAKQHQQECRRVSSVAQENQQPTRMGGREGSTSAPASTWTAKGRARIGARQKVPFEVAVAEAVVVVVVVAAAAAKQLAKAKPGNADAPRGPPVLSTTLCLYSQGGHWSRRPLPARIRAVGGVESQGWLHLQPLLDTPANHASGAFREVCRTLSRPKPL
jgi:hypothetical protein